MVIHSHLVVELRAVWRCVAYGGGVVGCVLVVGWERGGMRAGLGYERSFGCEQVLDVSVLDVDVVVVVKQ